jgi:hypothetical protein
MGSWRHRAFALSAKGAILHLLPGSGTEKLVAALGAVLAVITRPMNSIAKVIQRSSPRAISGQAVPV